MPRRNKRSRGRGSGRRNNSMFAPKISRVPFHQILAITLSGVTGISTLPLNPQTSPFIGVSEIADQFDLFKVQKLEYRIFPMDPTLTDIQTVAYYPDIDVQTLTTAQNSTSNIAACQTPFNGVPTPWMRVPASLLKGMIDWYKCTPDAGAAEFESQGVLYFAGGLGDLLTCEVRGVIAFKNPCSASLMLEHNIARLERLNLVVRIPKSTASPTKQ